MHLYLVHHGRAVEPQVDPRRPLSKAGRTAVDQLARATAVRGARPSAVWHSGKLRARQTAEAFWRVCNALAEFSATRDIQPTDPPSWMQRRLQSESRDVMIVGHFPHLPGLLTLLLRDNRAIFPNHGVVALSTDDEAKTWREDWRLDEGES